MTDRFDLSRRKLLGAVGTIGGAAALGGAGTMAFFSDTEEFANNSLTAGELDMKVGYSAHYSDWSPDEDGSDTDTTDDDVDVVMWDGAPNTTGTASDLPDGYTGLPANDAWLIAVDDPDQFLDNTQYAEDGSATCPGMGNQPTDAGDVEQPVISLDDVKPGDFGEVTFDFALCDNPGYVWLNGNLRSASENGVNEPEADDGDEDQVEGDGNPDLKPGESGEKTVELLDVVKAAFWIDDGGDGPGGNADGNNYQNGGESPAFVGSLREALDTLSAGGTGNNGRDGALLPGDISAESGGGMGANCFSAETTHSVAFAWWVPVDHGNEIQSDSAAFDLSFYTEQCRHNSAGDGGGGGLTTTTGDGFGKVDRPVVIKSRARYGNGNWEVGIGEGDVPSKYLAQKDWPTDISDVPWSLTYDSSSGETDFSIAGTTVSRTQTVSFDGRLVVTAKVDEASIDVENISLTVDESDQSLGATSLSVSDDDGAGDREVRFLAIESGLDGSQSFELSGTATVDTQPDFPGGDEDWAIDVSAQ